MRRSLVLSAPAALVCALITATPAAAQPACVAGTGFDYYQFVGGAGCHVNGILFTGFSYGGAAANMLITPWTGNGLSGFKLERVTPAIAASSAGATPGIPFANFTGDYWSFYAPSAVGMWFVVDPISLDGFQASADPGWRAFVRATAQVGGHDIWMEKMATGAPPVSSCFMDLAPVGCGVGTTRALHTGGEVRTELIANVTALPAPATGGASAAGAALFVGFARVSAVPEPATMGLVAAGVAGVAAAGAARRRRAGRMR